PFTQLLLGFPTTEALVGEVHGAAKVFAEALGESGGFPGHVPGCAVETDWPANDDAADGVTTAKVAQARDVVAAIGALEDGQRPSRDAELVGKRQAEAAAPVVDGKDGARGRVCFRTASGLGANGHAELRWCSELHPL